MPVGVPLSLRMYRSFSWSCHSQGPINLPSSLTQKQLQWGRKWPSPVGQGMKMPLQLFISMVGFTFQKPIRLKSKIHGFVSFPSQAAGRGPGYQQVHIVSVSVTFLLLWKDTKTKATCRRKSLLGVTFHRLSWWGAWQQEGRQGWELSP